MAPSKNNTVDAAASPGTPSNPVPSEKQMRFLAIVMQSATEKPQIDWNKVVGLSGHKNVRSAKESYRVMEAKLGLSSGGPPSSPTKVKKRTGKIGTKGRGKKASKKEELDGGEDADDGEDGIGSEGEKALAQDDEMEEGV